MSQVPITDESIATAIDQLDDGLNESDPQTVPAIRDILTDLQAYLVTAKFDDYLDLINDDTVDVLLYRLRADQIIFENSWEGFSTALEELGYESEPLQKVVRLSHRNEAQDVLDREFPPLVYPMVIAPQPGDHARLVEHEQLLALKDAVEMIRDKRPDDPETVSYALDDLERELNLITESLEN